MTRGMMRWGALLLVPGAQSIRLDSKPLRDDNPHYSLDGSQFPMPRFDEESPALASSCVPLRNRGSHYTARVMVGTPGNKLDLLVDTGSDAVIVNSCQCHDTGACDFLEKCYAPHRSTTFNQTKNAKGQAERAVFGFGSGLIDSRIGSDVVQVGNSSGYMTDGLFMLVGKQLNINTAFEGILGLGPPRDLTDVNASKSFSPYEFLQAAGVDRFSLCFKRGGAGLLRLGAPPMEKALGSVGKSHWGLKFRGISVGDWKIGGLCSQEGECAAMPDSGTTLITAPKEHLVPLFTHICEHWPRCKASFENNTYHTSHEWFHMQRLLLDCYDWAGLPGNQLNETQLNEELPHLRFKLAGAEGEQQTLRLRGEDYLVHMMSATHIAAPKFLGHMALPYDGKVRKVCAPAFHIMNATSRNMGQVWIMGLPIMQKFRATFDRSTKPASMSFSSGTCDDCSEVRLARSTGERSREEATQGLMWLDELPRVAPWSDNQEL